LRELHDVLAVSHSWRDAVGTMRSLEVILPYPSEHRLREVCASRLVRHVGTIGANIPFLSSASLLLIGASMKNLHTFRSFGWARPNNAATLVFPPKLTALHLGIAGTLTADLNAMILAVSRLPLLRSMRLWMLLISEPALVSFAPLQCMPLLDTLEIEWRDGLFDNVSPRVQLNDAQVDELHALPHLTSLDADFTQLSPDANLPRQLLRSPHSLPWTRLKTLVANGCALLPTMLPHITALACMLLSDPADFAFLAHLPRLVELHIKVSHLEHTPSVLRGCAGLTKLSLGSCQLSSAVMSNLIPCLANLRDLSLYRLNGMDSLGFLSRGSLPRTLTRLELSFCQHPDLHTSELRHVNALKELHSLVIERCFVEPLDSLVILFYSQPESPLLPKLTQFKYVPRTSHSDKK